MIAIQNQRSCCEPQERQDNKILSALEKISAVALGIFSAYANVTLFFSSFLFGIAIGFYQERDYSVTRRAVTCSQGLMEQLTGTKLPPLVSLLANIAVAWCHIDHHTSVFVPITGISLGAWAGQTMGAC